MRAVPIPGCVPERSETGGGVAAADDRMGVGR
jgi:hypothetical protein